MAPRDPVNQYDYVFLKGEGNKGVSYKYTWGSGTWRLPPGVKASKVCADTAETAPSKGEACAYAGGGCVSDPMSYTTAGGLVTAAPASYRPICAWAEKYAELDACAHQVALGVAFWVGLAAIPVFVWPAIRGPKEDEPPRPPNVYARIKERNREERLRWIKAPEMPPR